MALWRWALAGGHREVALPGPTRRQEFEGAARVVGARDDPPRRVAFVARAVAGANRRGQLGEGRIQDLDVIARVVGRRVARAKDVTQRLAREIAEAEQWVEAEPALVGRRGG